ncbi:hypothetical protein R6Q59_009081 [Mikania micrantha]
MVIWVVQVVGLSICRCDGSGLDRLGHGWFRLRRGWLNLLLIVYLFLQVSQDMGTEAPTTFGCIAAALNNNQLDCYIYIYIHINIKAAWCIYRCYQGCLIFMTPNLHDNYNITLWFKSKNLTGSLYSFDL